MAYTLFDAFGREPVAQTEDELAANARPVTQTIKTNPVTGEQTMTVSGSPQDLSAANPLTPTVSPVAPMAPVVGGPMPQPMIESTALPAQTIMPVMPNANPTDDRLAMGTQAAPMSVASPMSTAMAPTPITRAVEPVAAPMAAPMAAPVAAPMAAAPIPQAPAPIPPAVSMQPAQGAASEGTAGESDAQMQMRNAGAALAEAGNDKNKLIAVYGNKALPISIQNAAAETALGQMQLEQAQKKVETKVKEAIQNNDMSGIQKLLAQQGNTGSIAKAFMYSLIGFKSGAEAEVAKMNLPKEWRSVTDAAGKTSLILFSTSNMPIKGLNSDGAEMTPQEVIKAGATSIGKNITTGQELLQDNRGEVYKSGVDEKGKAKLININPAGPAYAGGGFTSYKGQQQVGTTIQKLAIDLQGKGATAGIEAIAELKKERRVSPEEERIIMDAAVNTGRAAAATVPTQIPNIPTGARTTGAVTPVAVAPVAPANIPAAPATVTTGAGTPVAPANIPAAPAAVGASVAQARPVTTPAAGGGGRAGGTLAQAKAANELAKKQGETNIEIIGKRTEGVNKYIDETIVSDGRKGDVIVDNITKQLKLFQDPVKSEALFAVGNAVNASPGDQKWTMVRDILAGKFDSNNEIELRQRLAKLGLNSEQVSTLAEYNTLNGPLVQATVKAIGGTQISDRDRAAAEKLQVDITQVPALGAYNIKANQLFGGQLARYKSDWVADKNYDNVALLEKNWRKEEQRLIESNGLIQDKRMQFIKANGSTYQAVREAYKQYPVPEYDSTSNQWKKLRPIGDIMGGNR